MRFLSAGMGHAQIFLNALFPHPKGSFLSHYHRDRTVPMNMVTCLCDCLCNLSSFALWNKLHPEGLLLWSLHPVPKIVANNGYRFFMSGCTFHLKKYDFSGTFYNLSLLGSHHVCAASPQPLPHGLQLSSSTWESLLHICLSLWIKILSSAVNKVFKVLSFFHFPAEPSSGKALPVGFHVAHSFLLHLYLCSNITLSKGLSRATFLPTSHCSIYPLSVSLHSFIFLLAVIINLRAL